MTLPVAMTGHDVIGQAKTGTGKTLGFGLPIIDSVRVAADVDAGRLTAAELPTAPQALVVVPTRELCTQVTNDLLVAGKVRNVRVLSIYGGRGYETQIEALERGVDVIVGTPGRLLDLARQKKLDLSAVRVLVLDEADEMLDLGFLPDVEKIIDQLPAQRQTMLFSATMPGAVISLARRYMNRPTHIRATQPDDQGATVANISQHIYRAHSLDKVEMVARILQAEGRNLAMIFCRTKRTTADVAEQLTKRGFAAGAVHGDLGQGAREQALRAFRNGKVDILVCTDVAARGIDVEGVTHVMNYQCPEDEKTYLHRIGRTGRAGASGTAVTLVDWDDIPRWQLINKALDLKFNEPEETYSSSPHLYAELNIPAGTKGVLPRAERTRAGLDAEEIEDLGEPGGGRRRGATKPAGRGEGRTGDRDVERDADRPAGRRERDRKRRRTRSGADATASAETVEAQAAPTAAPAPGEVAENADAPGRRRRRRTRSGDQAAEIAAETEVDAAETAAVEVAQAAAPVVEAAPVVTEEAPVEPRRRRTRTAKVAAEAPVEVAETPVAVEAPAAVQETAVVEETPAPRKRTRATKKAVAEVAEAPVVIEAPATVQETAPVEETPAPRKRTRATKKAAAEVVEAAEAVVAEALVAEAIAPVTEEAPAPRRRTRAAKATVEVPSETPAATETPAVEETPAPRKRTRATKKAVTEVAETPATVEAPAAVQETAVVAKAAAPLESVATAPAIAPRKRRRATSGVTDATAKAAGLTAPTAEEEAPAPVESPTLPAPRKRRRATSGVTDATARAAERISSAAAQAAEPEVPTQRGEATPIAAEEERPKRKRRSVRLAEAAAAALP
ncbi:DEAD/DEAH box helicase, partial [Streptacidiphilus neutrinimicus]|uniref:DEAD/DEAH box helicase n=1 Tax=Streptacidiphilus neutrinimicus TaxID=105420 RepID=UPI0007C7E62F